MKLRWIRQPGGRFVAIHGQYRLLIQPAGLMFHLSISEALGVNGAAEWEPRWAQNETSLQGAQRAGQEWIDGNEAQCAVAMG